MNLHVGFGFAGRATSSFEYTLMSHFLTQKNCSCCCCCYWCLWVLVQIQGFPILGIAAWSVRKHSASKELKRTAYPKHLSTRALPLSSPIGLQYCYNWVRSKLLQSRRVRRTSLSQNGLPALRLSSATRREPPPPPPIVIGL